MCISNSKNPIFVLMSAPRLVLFCFYIQFSIIFCIMLVFFRTSIENLIDKIRPFIKVYPFCTIGITVFQHQHTYM